MSKPVRRDPNPSDFDSLCDMGPFFSGEKLWGDDFDEAGLEAWFADEAEASFDLGETRLRGEYPWAGQQWRNCYAHLPRRR